MKASEILALFVAKQDPREYLKLPTRANGCLYATNGHICVRGEDDPEVTELAGPDAAKIPHRIDEYIAECPADAVFHPLKFERNGHLAPSWCKQARTAIADAEKTK